MFKSTIFRFVNYAKEDLPISIINTPLLRMHFSLPWHLFWIVNDN